MATPAPQVLDRQDRFLVRNPTRRVLVDLGEERLFGLAPIVVTIGQAIETDTGRPITRVKTRAVGQAVETEAAQPVARVKTRTLGLATETDTATTFTRLKTLTLGRAVETDSATAVQPTRARAISQAVEVDSAEPIGAGGIIVIIGQAVETDLALGCLRAWQTVLRPSAGPVTRPSTGTVYRPDSGRVCRP